MMSELDHVFSVKLVKAVEKHPCLYNYDLPDYSNKIVMDAAWEIVAKEVDSSVAYCKSKWRNIRTVFARHLKIGRGGGKRRNPYYLSDVLPFLAPFVKPLSDSAGHVPHTDHEVTSISSEFAPSKCTRTSSTSEPVSTRSQTSSPTVEAQNSSGFAKPNTKITAKKARVLQNMSTTDKAVVDFCSQQWGSTVAEDSPRKLFVSSLMSDIESMTDQQFRQFRMKVLPLIDGILSETPPSEGSVTSARSPLQFESVHTQWPKTELHSDYE